MPSLADSLWSQNSDLALAALNHSFVNGIATGKLAHTAFAYYTGQDAVFLDAFSRAYALASAKCPDRRGSLVFAELRDGAADELNLHRGYAERWGVDLHQKAGPATAAYAAFLLAVAEQEPVGHIAAAMTPCMRLYTYLGQRLVVGTADDNPFREWVTTYSSERFAALAQRLEALLDRYGGDPVRMAVLYRRAMQLELEFFDDAASRQ